MKKSLTKSLIGIVSLSVAFTVYTSCSENQLRLSNTDQLGNDAGSIPSEASFERNANPLNKNVGRPLKKDIAERWIKNYNRVYKRNMSYTLSANELQQILSESNCVGICLYYSLDNDNNIHILPIGIDNNTNKIKRNRVKCKGGYIDWSTAMEWINRNNQNAVAHFFGSKMFDRMMRIEGISSIKTTFALDDNNKPQLLLSDADDVVPGYKDASVTCPPVCPK